MSVQLVKKILPTRKFRRLEDVMLIPEGFNELLTFPSVEGIKKNDILHLTEVGNPLRENISHCQKQLRLVMRKLFTVTSGKWGGNPWALIDAKVKKSPIFYGHSHQSLLIRWCTTGN